VGLALAIAALVLLAALPADLPLAAVLSGLGLVGTGMGALFPVTTVAVQNAVKPYQLGTATGAIDFLRQLSGALIVAAFGAIVLGGGGGIGHPGLTLETLAVQKDAFAGSDFAEVFRWVFIAAAALLAAGLLLLFAMEERPLRGRQSEVVPAE